MPVVRDAWVRMTPTMPMGAGFFTIENRCAGAVVLTGASSPRFADVSMHETQLAGGISRMRPLRVATIGPGRQLAFRPGGRHLMLMSPAGGITEGGRVRIDLQFADGRRLPVEFVVRAAAP